MDLKDIKKIASSLPLLGKKPEVDMMTPEQAVATIRQLQHLQSVQWFQLVALCRLLGIEANKLVNESRNEEKNVKFMEDCLKHEGVLNQAEDRGKARQEIAGQIQEKDGRIIDPKSIKFKPQP